MDRRPIFAVIALLALSLQAACGPTLAPTALAPVVIASPVAVEPTAIPPTAPPLPLTATAPAPAPPVLSMEVGTTFRYFDGSLLVPVAAGPFTMGSGGPDNPVHTVNLSDFWIYAAEVTNRMYSLCVAAGKCSPPDATDNAIFSSPLHQNKPVVGVTWQQAADYCAFVNGRLPTEAEWEKTARGPQGNTFPWGEEQPTCDRLNFGTCVHKTTDVGLYPKGESYYHAVDMSGNVFEWNADWYLASYYGAAPTQDPLGAETGSKRSYRSSAFNSDGFLTEPARRFSALPDQHRAELGFRCVVEDPTAFAPMCSTPSIYGDLGPGGFPGVQMVAPDCPTISIGNSVTCDYTNVWVKVIGGDAVITGPEGCDPIPSDPGVHGYLCHPGDATGVKVCPKCTFASSGVSCMPGYEMVGDQCLIKVGWPGQCPDGTTYDPTQLCCAPPGGIVGGEHAACPLGTSEVFDPVSGDLVACYPGPGIECKNFTIEWSGPCEHGKPDCDPETDPNCQPCDPQTDPNACRPPTNTCCNSPGASCSCCPGLCGCLAPRAAIDTPSGPIAANQIQVGEPVWTVDASGNRVPGSVIRVSSRAVTASYVVVHLVLADGRELYVSPSHPTADGRTIGALKVGDALDGSLVTVADLVAYDQPATYDLLPSGETGFYWANGILIGSTLSGR